MRATAVDGRGVGWDVHVEWIGRRLDEGPLLRRWHARRRRRLERKLPNTASSKEKSSDRSDWLHLLDVGPDLPGAIAAIFLIIAAAVIVILVGPWFVALLLGAIEFTFIVLACIGAVVTRTVMRRPWRVVARSASGEQHTWQLVGWRRSRRLVKEIAAAVDQGMAPTAVGVEHLTTPSRS